MFVELSSFHTCSSLSDGGAIYFGTSGQCVLSSVCGVKCSTDNNYWGQLCYVYVSDDSQYKNHIIDSSVTLTEKQNANLHCILHHERGNVLCKGVNISNNEVYRYSGIYIWNPSLSSISFSSFINNKATGSNGYICIDCQYNKHQMNNTNIIENNQQSSDYGTIYVYSSTLVMRHCNVYRNRKKGAGNVFTTNDGNITCYDCYIPNDQKEQSSSESVKFTEESSKSIINSYSFFVLDSCKVEMNCFEDNRTSFIFSSHMLKCILRIFLYCFIFPS